MAKMRKYVVYSMNKKDDSHQNIFYSTHNANTRKNYEDADKVLKELPENADWYKIIITCLVRGQTK